MVVPSHLPEDGGITIFDRERIARNRVRALQTFDEHDFLFQWAKGQIVDRISDINRTFPIALHIGSRQPVMAEDHKKISCSFYLDMAADCPRYSGRFIQASEEFLPFKSSSLDLVSSNLNLHSVNDLPGTLLQIRRSLKPDGLFIAAMFGGETLYQLRDVIAKTEAEIYGGVSPRIFPFADKPQMGDLMQRAGFALPVIDSELIHVTYDNIFKLLHDLRGMGEGNAILARDKRPLGKDFFMRLAQDYMDRYSEPDGRIVATFEVIFLLGWAPHESQQKPLRPGSAETRLADVLGVHENKMDGN